MLNKKSLIILMSFILLTVILVGCSSSTTSADPVTDTTKLFASISRIERETPQGMQFTEEQVNKILEIIDPIVSGLPLTPDLAKSMTTDLNKLLNDQQNNLVNEAQSKLGTPGEGPGMTGQGPGTGPGAGGGTPGSGANGGMNMFIRLDEVLRENYSLN